MNLTLNEGGENLHPELNETNFRPHGLCYQANVDRTVFFPKKTDSTEKYRSDVEAAKVICNACVVVDICREVGAKNKEDGIWGGMTKEERRQYFRSSQKPENKK